MKSSRVRSSRYGRYQAADESVFLQVTMLLVKGGLGFLAVVLAGVALMNYRILLHHDGQVEFARKTEWTLADSFRFIPEEAPIATVASVAPPAPPPPPPVAPAPVVARALPTPAPEVVHHPSVKAPAPVVAHVAHPAPARPVKASPAAQLIARARPAASTPRPPASGPRPAEDDESDDPIRAVLSTVRPVEPANPEAADCRRIRGKLRAAVARMDAKYPASKARELHVFDLIQEGYLDSLQSCPSMGGYQLQRKSAAAEIRCTVHGSI